MDADRQVLVDDHAAADEQHEDQADLGEVLHQGGEAGPQVGVLDVAPLHPVGRRGQLAQLLLLGGEASTTRTPLTFSSTTVATSARRDWISHETGNIDLRILTPTT